MPEVPAGKPEYSGVYRDKHVHKSIYHFLLESGYPRASIITDPASLDPAMQEPATESSHPPSVASGPPVHQSYQPTFLIVDPDTCARLAVIDVVESGLAEDVSARGLQALLYTRQFTGQHILSYVLQVDVNNPVEANQVRFYKVSQKGRISPVSSYAFPDLDSIRVGRVMEIRNGVPGVDDEGDAADASDAGSVKSEADRGILVVYFLALVLALIGVIDWLLIYSSGLGIFTLQQILLFIVAVLLFAIPLLLRQFRQ